MFTKWLAALRTAISEKRREASPTIIRAATALTPLQISKEVEAARPAQRDGIAQTFVGTPVDWLLIFRTANRPWLRDESRRTNWQLFFGVKKGDNVFVTFEIPIKGNEYLRGVDKGETFRVKGVIKEIGRPSSTIQLDNVSLERVSQTHD